MPTANSLQANTLGEFAGTAYSLSLPAIEQNIKKTKNVIMNHLLIFTFLLFNLISTFSQNINAGDTTGITFYDFEPDIVLEAQGNNNIIKIDSIDINFDGIEDLFFQVIGTSSTDYIDFKILHENIEACRYFQGGCTQLYSLDQPISCDSLLFGMVWFHYNSWSNWASIASYFPPFPGGGGCWYNWDNKKYFSFRYLSPPDTLYGWVEIDYYSISTEISLIIKSFGIEGDFVSSLHSLNSNELEIFPNPTEEFLNLSGSKFSNSVISIFDLAGKLIKKYSLNSNRIDVSFLNPGIYFLKIEDEKEVLINQFIKL